MATVNNMSDVSGDEDNDIDHVDQSPTRTHRMTTRVLQTAGSVGITITTQENAINMDKTLLYCKTAGYVIAMDIGYELVMITCEIQVC